MPPNGVVMLPPVLVERKTFSKSTNPPGVNSVPPMRNDSGDSFGFSVSCTTVLVLVAVVAGAAVLCRAASAIRGVPEVFSCNCCCRFWICCCCWEICACWEVMASRRDFSSSATDEFWPCPPPSPPDCASAMPAAKTRKPNLDKTLMNSPLIGNRFLQSPCKEKDRHLNPDYSKFAGILVQWLPDITEDC